MKFETPLCEIAYKYGTDKCPQVVHSYTPFYHAMFRPGSDRVRKVVELGIGYAGDMEPPSPPHYVTGASLLMWRDFFPNATVYGADIQPLAMFMAERVRTILCDERKRSNLENLIRWTGSDVDIFIDDGIHRKREQIFVARTILPLLGKKAVYIVEDVRAPEAVIEALPEYDCRMVKFQKGKRRDDCLVIVRHRD